jgi:hypothetical protein
LCKALLQRGVVLFLAGGLQEPLALGAYTPGYDFLIVGVGFEEAVIGGTREMRMLEMRGQKQGAYTHE